MLSWICCFICSRPSIFYDIENFVFSFGTHKNENGNVETLFKRNMSEINYWKLFVETQLPRYALMASIADARGENVNASVHTVSLKNFFEFLDKKIHDTIKLNNQIIDDKCKGFLSQEYARDELKLLKKCLEVAGTAEFAQQVRQIQLELRDSDRSFVIERDDN